MLHSYVTDMAARVTPTTQIPLKFGCPSSEFRPCPRFGHLPYLPTKLGLTAESRTGPEFEQPTFNCNICSNFTHITSRACLNHSQEPCEWVDADLGVLWVESGQELHSNVGCSNFGPIRDSAIYSTYLPQNPNSSSSRQKQKKYVSTYPHSPTSKTSDFTLPVLPNELLRLSGESINIVFRNLPFQTYSMTHKI